MRRRSLLVVLALLAVPGVPARADGGGVWTSTLQATEGFDQLSLFPNGVGYAMYVDTYAKTTDAGLSWVVMPRPPRQYFGSPGIRFATPTIGWSVASASPDPGDLDTNRYNDEIKRCGDLMPLQRTTDGGTTWKAVCVPKSRTVDVKSHFGVAASPLGVGRDGKTLMLVGEESDFTKPLPPCGTTSSVIYTTHDAGSHWVRAQLPRGWIDGYRNQVYDSSTMLHLAYYYDEDASECSSGTVGLFVSRDGGKSFKKTYVCRVQPTCVSVTMISRNRIMLGRTDGSTLVTNDGGKTWRLGQRLFEQTWQPAIDSGAMQPWFFWAQALSFTDSMHGYASTRGSGTWRTVDGGFSWTQERSHECGYYIPGIGEIAAGSATTAITGGPHFISARTETPLPSQPCVAPRPQAAAGPAFAWEALDGTAAIRADGVYVRR